jgi:hypothetical protein
MEASMDQNRLAGRLSRIFWWLGHLAMLGVLFTLANRASGYLGQLGGQNGFVYQFSLLQECRSVITSLADGFFLYLVSSVFQMIQHRRPIHMQRTGRIMQACCALYTVSAAVGFLLLCILIKELSSDGLHWYWAAATGLMTRLSALTPFLYAVSIYFLYRHFAGLVEFESEVV